MGWWLRGGSGQCGGRLCWRLAWAGERASREEGCHEQHHRCDDPAHGHDSRVIHLECLALSICAHLAVKLTNHAGSFSFVETSE